MLLMKLFIKDYQQADSPAVREKCGILSGAFGIFFNMLLSALKFVIGAITNSVAITADAFNNLTDCLTSLLTILGFRWSAKPADKEHPFGHARIEYLVSLAVAGIILVTGYEVMRSSISMILNPEPMTFTPWAVGVLIFGMLVKFWMFLLNRKLGNWVNSNTLRAVGIDSRNDVLITAATLFSLVFTLLTDFIIDGYVGALIALVFLRSGYKVAKEALSRIIGNPAERDMASEIKAIVKNHDGVLGVHGLVVHNYGPGRDMASLHVEIPMDISLLESHNLIEKIGYEVWEKLGIPLVMQLDPINVADERLQDLIHLTRNYLQEEHPALYANEFRIVRSMPKPILVFDLEIPHEYKKRALVLRDSVSKRVKEMAPAYDCVINIEYSYVD